MKVYIGTDMEGVNGVVTREHTPREGREHDRARAWLTEEINAAVAGALDAGATEIAVEDGHGTCRTILPDLLHPRARLITGQVTSLPPSMVHGLDGSFDAVLFIGYHARAGTPNANLDHTSWSQTVRHVRVNGQEVGETSIMSAYAGYHGVPAVCVSGDDKLGREMDELQPEVEQAIVKQALGRYVCEMLPIEEGRALIREKARRGIERRKEIKPFAFAAPATLELEFLHPLYADLAALVPTCEQTGPEKVAVTSSDYLTLFNTFAVMCATSAIALQSNAR
jgi:D-amino peptidase